MLEGEKGSGGHVPVHFLPISIEGRLGFSFLPGRRGRDSEGRYWTRDLDEDLERLARVIGAEVLILLSTPDEQAACRVTQLASKARHEDMDVLIHPLPAHAEPEQAAVKDIISQIEIRLSRKQTVILSSSDGLGRAPLVAACFLVNQGSSAERAISTIRKLRGPSCLRKDVHTRFMDAFEELLTKNNPPVPTPTQAWPQSMPPPMKEVEPTSVLRTVGSKVAAALYAKEGTKDADRPPKVDFPTLSVGAFAATQHEIEPSALEPPIAQSGPEAPPIEPTALTPLESAIVGCMLGGALGDALGYPLRTLDQATLQHRYGQDGPESAKLMAPPGGGAPIALVSEPTQQAECAVEMMIEAITKRLELSGALERLKERLAGWAEGPKGGHRNPDPNALEAGKKMARGIPWTEAGTNASQGSSSLARATAFGLSLFRDLSRCEHWGSSQSRLTHRAPASVASASAMAVGVARALAGESVNHIVSSMVASACRIHPQTAAKLAQALHDADAGVPPRAAFERWTDASASDALAAAVFMIRRTPDDFEAAVRASAMVPGHGHAVGFCVGSLLGARLGAGALPPSWLTVLERRQSLESLSLALAATGSR